MTDLSPACSYFLQLWHQATNGGRIPQLHNAFNARIVLRELLDEIDVNQLKNRENKDYFQGLIAHYIKADRSVKRRLRPALVEIAQEIQHYHRRPLYLRQLCKAALAQCESLQFFDDNLDELVVLTAGSELTDETKREISLICNNLIVELLAVGYAEGDLKELMESCFDSVQRIGEGVYWRFPNNVVYPKDADNAAIDRYEASLLELQAGLTEADRIKKLIWYATRAAESYSFIFKSYGLRNKRRRQATIHDVTFYSPSMKRYYQPENEGPQSLADETFGDKSSEAVNAYVSVQAISARSAEMLARAKVEEAISVSALSVHVRNRVTLSGSHIRLRDGRLDGANYHAFDRPGSNWFDDIEVEAIRSSAQGLDALREAAANNGWARRLNEAAFWLRRAREAGTLAERFLDFWIAVETLCAKSSRSSGNWFETKDGQEENAITIIRDVCSRSAALARLRGECHQLHKRVRAEWKLGNPVDLGERMGLRPAVGTPVSICPLLKGWSEVATYLDDNLLLDDGARISAYINNAGLAKETLERYRQDASHEILFLYRTRNKIAHDGDTRHHMLEILCSLAERYVHVLLMSLRIESEACPGSSLDEILVSSYQSYAALLKSLDVKSADTCALIFRDRPSDGN